MGYEVQAKCWPGMGGRGLSAVTLGGPGKLEGFLVDDPVVTKDFEEMFWAEDWEKYLEDGRWSGEKWREEKSERSE